MSYGYLNRVQRRHSIHSPHKLDVLEILTFVLSIIRLRVNLLILRNSHSILRKT